MCEAELKQIEGEERWVRTDGKKCYSCESSYSTSPELFEVEYESGEKKLFCSVCISEGPLENPEQIKIMRRVE